MSVLAGKKLPNIKRFQIKCFSGDLRAPPNHGTLMFDETLLFIFMLAAFLGFQLIKRVSPLLHSPLMSLTNAISAIAVVGAITIAGEKDASPFAQVLGFIAIMASTINLVGGYLITDRMLKMFRKRGDRP